MASDPRGTSSVSDLWVPADAVRVAGTVAVVVAVLWFDSVAVALMLLVLGGLMVPRALGTPGRLDVAYGTALLVAAWSGVLGWYEQISWWDLVVHFVVTGLVSAMAYLVAGRLGVARDPADVVSGAQRWGVVMLTTGLGLGLSVLWELAEWLGHTYVDQSIHVGEVDTLGDLAAGGLGSLVAGHVLVTLLRRATGASSGGTSSPGSASSGRASSASPSDRAPGRSAPR